MSYIDDSYSLLVQKLQSFEGSKLLILDENTPLSLYSMLSRIQDLTVLTNRYDINQTLLSENVPCSYSDFDFAEVASRCNVVAYRLSKEKSVVNHVLDAIPRLLTAEGHLLLLGNKNQGFPSTLKKLTKSWNIQPSLVNLKNGEKLADFALPQKISQYKNSNDASEYKNIEPISLMIGGLPVYSKRGAFGWNKQDQGSQFLIETLNSNYIWSNLSTSPVSMLDLGCGYGYLTMHAAEKCPNIQITATDNNAAALLVCQKNMSYRGLNAKVIASDCASSIKQRFDLILCNPPFHQGFRQSEDLSIKFVRQIGAHLAAQGVAYLVVNAFLSYEKWAHSCKLACNTLANNRSFKVLEMRQP